jgi:hypothetical protein
MLCFFTSILFIVLFKKFIKPYVSKRQYLPLPPGSMGWPYIGETFQLYSQDPNVFFASKIKRFIENSSTFQYLNYPSSWKILTNIHIQILLYILGMVLCSSLTF